ncbi:MAG: inorganic diphosphatase [Ureaplasma sp.]|nr:inorganic diphosphatase [Ureaplasma sp.]
MKLNAIIEIPKKSDVKYEFNRETKQIEVDRVLYGSMSYPQNYGFLKEALDYDGDELDMLIIANHSFLPGVVVPVRLLGAMEMIDSGETDTKLIGVIDCDPRFEEYKTLENVPKHLLKEIEDFFANYKNLQNKKVEVLGFKDYNWAVKEYNECVKLMNKYKDVPKAEFIKIMQKEHPEKYKK